MKVILTDVNHRYDYVDIVLYENLSYTEAYLRAKNYNETPKEKRWYTAAITPDNYQTVRLPHEDRRY